jgi:hypothetical protein
VTGEEKWTKRLCQGVGLIVSSRNVREGEIPVVNVMSSEMVMDIDVLCARMIMRIFCEKEAAFVVPVQRGARQRNREALEEASEPNRLGSSKRKGNVLRFRT